MVAESVEQPPHCFVEITQMVLFHNAGCEILHCPGREDSAVDRKDTWNYSVMCVALVIAHVLVLYWDMYQDAQCRPSVSMIHSQFFGLHSLHTDPNVHVSEVSYACI